MWRLVVLLVVVGVREVGDVQPRSMTYAARQAGADPAERPAHLAVLLVVVAAQHLHGAVPRTVGAMTYDTPRDANGLKLCAWCGGSIRQSGVGRSKDYCSRLCRERAYRKRRDQRLIDEALAAAAADSSTRETSGTSGPVYPVDETGSVQVLAPAPSGDFLLAPPAPSPQESPVLPDAWKAPAPRRKLSRNRSAMSAEAMPLWPSEEFRPEGADGE